MGGAGGRKNPLSLPLVAEDPRGIEALLAFHPHAPAL